MIHRLPPLAPKETEPESLLKRTRSRCPICHRSLPAEVVRRGGDPGSVHLHRVCPEHGPATTCLATDARLYWVSHGGGEPEERATCTPGSACCARDGTPAGPLGRNARLGGGTSAPFESLSTCLALIEVVDSCNLACPTCYADSPVGTGDAIRAPSLASLQQRIQGVIERKGGIEILQLSGGEPTLHPQFFELLEWTMANPGVDYVLLNTNGVRLAREREFGDRLRDCARYGKFQAYLQFDGPQAAGQADLRGADLREVRVRAIERLAELGLPLTLAMTVTPANLPHLWETIAFGLRWDHIRGVTFQPMFQSGRRPGAATSTPTPAASRRLNTADLVLAMLEQSQGVLGLRDFTPLPCGDPNCAVIGYLLKAGGTVKSVGEFVDFQRLQGFLQDRLRYRPEDLVRCGCESEPLGALLKQFEIDERHTFRLFIKPFMDSWSWDQDRIDRCCTHVIRPDGSLDSFCRYYAPCTA